MQTFFKHRSGGNKGESRALSIWVGKGNVLKCSIPGNRVSVTGAASAHLWSGHHTWGSFMPRRDFVPRNTENSVKYSSGRSGPGLKMNHKAAQRSQQTSLNSGWFLIEFPVLQHFVNRNCVPGAASLGHCRWLLMLSHKFRATGSTRNQDCCTPYGVKP